MHVEKIKLRSVSGIQRHLFYRGGKHTTFGFAGDSFSRRSAVVQGWPEINVDSEVSFVLARQDVWENVLGWYDHKKSPKVTPDVAGSILASLLFLTVFISCIWLCASNDYPSFLLFLAIASLGGLFFWLHLSVKASKATALVNRLEANASCEAQQ